MSLVAVQSHVKSLLMDLPMTGYSGTLVTYIAPPVPGDMSVPNCYIWGGTWTEARFTAPRNYGFKKLLYTLSIWLFVAEDPNSEGVDTRFPALIEDVMHVLRTTEMPVPIQDPLTGTKSQLVSIGESMTVNYDTERTLADQRYVRMLALIEASIEEDIVG